jgi:tRNA 5-methylaminomethyl-2-thiouridine biosynthesis bifunctional protein
MKPGNTPWRPVETAELDWPDTDTPRSSRFDDIYYSRSGGIAESELVFLEANRLAERWPTHSHPEFCVAETGFGTGLNFLLTWAAWRRQPSPPRLHFISVEKYPLAKRDMARALANWPTLHQEAATLLDNYPEPIPGTHRIVLEQGRLILDLWWEDVADALPDLASSVRGSVDAWFLDGFAPARNEDMWTPVLYSAMAAASRRGATFATFTAAGDVRRGLMKAGFGVIKAPGYGHKRERLLGALEDMPPTATPSGTPWDIASARAPFPRSALIIGAGVAGCTTAAALAQRGIAVTLLEQNQVASAGSGNKQGILYTRLSAKHSSLTDFSLQSFCFAYRYYQNLFLSGSLIEGADGALCGSFHQSGRLEEMATLGEVLHSVPELAQVLSADQASEILGVVQPSGGYWFPKSGWMHPAAVCRALIDHPNICLLENTGEIALRQTTTGWRALAAGNTVVDADCAVVATGTSANHQEMLSWLPLQTIRGQTTHIPFNPVLDKLRSGFCHSGYISPTRQQSHCIGATFTPNDHDPSVRIEDHRHNLEKLADAVPDWRDALGAIDPTSLSGRVSYRCATPDYLPIVGAVPDYESFMQTYGGLRKNAKQPIPHYGNYMPGLFLTTGHGSRGLTSTPLAAEILASQICGEAPPLSRELYRAIAPGRFIIRQLRRARI